MSENTHKFATIQDAFAFTFAGKAIITLESRKTDKHFTYRVKQAKDNNELFFVSVLVNTGEYNYIGIVTKRGFQWTKRSTVPQNAPCLVAFNWFFNLKTLPYELTVRHEGKCGCCGRSLTVPASIDRGIGPECAKRVKIAPVIPIEEMHTEYDYNA